MNQNKKRILIRAAAICLAAAAVLAGLLLMTDFWEKSEYREVRSTGTKEFMEEGQVIWEGAKYRKTPAVTTILIAGIDKTEQSAGTGSSKYRNGGQADFLLLLAIDHTKKKIHRLQIDRDTMTDVTVLSVYGKETGTRVLQICLAHSYGAAKDDNAKYTVRAVKHLMNDIEITGYYMVDYSAVPILNDTLGGVTVTVPDDMTSVNPQWQLGSTVTLHGAEAETFVRTRKTVGSGSNAERMRRQQEFTNRAILAMNQRLAENPEFSGTLLAALKKNAVTNIPQEELLLEISESHAYDIQPIDYLEGEYRIADNGFAEFHAEADSVTAWIMTHLYTKE